jgi:hypothetical protein
VHKLPEDLAVEVIAGLESKGEEWGDFTVRYVDVPAHNDVTPLMRDFPGGLCPSPHWGIVVAGAITAGYDDGTAETTSAGELFYWRPGHTGWTDDVGCTFIEFSPTALLKPVLEQMARTAAADAAVTPARTPGGSSASGR